MYIEPNGDENYIKVIRLTHFVKLIKELKVFRLNDLDEDEGENDEELNKIVVDMLD